MKTCTVCEQSLPLEAFRAERNQCIECVKAYQRKHASAWQKNNPTRYKDRQLRTKYGISLAQYDQILVSQNGCCGICRSDHPKGRGAWHVDHDHATGQVRGLLCVRCNIGIGNLDDDPITLARAIDYLLDPPALATL